MVILSLFISPLNYILGLFIMMCWCWAITRAISSYPQSHHQFGGVRGRRPICDAVRKNGNILSRLSHKVWSTTTTQEGLCMWYINSFGSTNPKYTPRKVTRDPGRAWSGLVWQWRFNDVPWSREQQNAHELRINYSLECRRVLLLHLLLRGHPIQWPQQQHFSAPPRKVLCPRERARDDDWRDDGDIFINNWVKLWPEY